MKQFKRLRKTEPILQIQKQSPTKDLKSQTRRLSNQTPLASLASSVKKGAKASKAKRTNQSNQQPRPETVSAFGECIQAQHTKQDRDEPNSSMALQNIRKPKQGQASDDEISDNTMGKVGGFSTAVVNKNGGHAAAAVEMGSKILAAAGGGPAPTSSGDGGKLFRDLKVSINQSGKRQQNAVSNELAKRPRFSPGLAQDRGAERTRAHLLSSKLQEVTNVISSWQGDSNSRDDDPYEFSAESPDKPAPKAGKGRAGLPWGGLPGITASGPGLPLQAARLVHSGKENVDSEVTSGVKQARSSKTATGPGRDPKLASKPTTHLTARKLPAASASTESGPSESPDSEGGSEAKSWGSEFQPDSGSQESLGSASEAERPPLLNIQGRVKRANAMIDAPGITFKMEARRPKISLPIGNSGSGPNSEAGRKTAEGIGKKIAGKLFAQGKELSLVATNTSSTRAHPTAVVEIPPGMELQGDTGIIGRLDTKSCPPDGFAPGRRNDARIPVVDLKGKLYHTQKHQAAGTLMSVRIHAATGTPTIENLFTSFLAAKEIEGQHNQGPPDSGYASCDDLQGYNSNGGGEEAEKKPKPGRGKGKAGQAPNGKRAGPAKAKGPRKGAAKKGGAKRKKP